MFFIAIGAAWFIKFLTITAFWINAASAHLKSKNNVNLKKLIIMNWKTM